MLIGLIFFKSSENPRNPVEIRINEKEYHLEMAKTKTQIAKGLMLRDTLPKDEGMLFVFPREARHTFWMYKTKIPLDIIWLNENWEFVHIERNVPPCKSSDPIKCPRYKPKKEAKYVIEISPRTY